ncbi:hypothetical protein [Jidongwangia harbinensis]|uniref:hypothetical protein n=1 Tax=Jidongwangia harbinensis TaxID=2878561 RepID=UPI001CD9943B|nr:hypothetical protein [Jidongwangia harbinensis]MCA2217455.1 hypothetical protein [Jidongwangia harbinensis]
MDVNTPSFDGAVAAGVFKTYDSEHHKPDGWTENAVGRIRDEIHDNARDHPKNIDFLDESNYSKEELDAYDWYQDHVLDINNWTKIATEFNKKSGSKDAVQYEHAPAEGKNYGLKDDDGFRPPVVHEWSDSVDKGKGVAVNTQALRHFAKQLEAIEPDGTGGVAWQAWDKLNKVSIKPGGFAKAEVLRQKINGAGGDDDGLRGGTMDTLMTVHQAIYNLRKSLIKLADEYDSAEELNKMTGDQLTDAMKNAWAQIEKLKNSGTDEASLDKGTPDSLFK